MHRHVGDKTARGWFYFSELNIKVQCWHEIGLVFNANKHKHGSTGDNFSDSFRAKGSYKYGGALFMNKQAQSLTVGVHQRGAPFAGGGVAGQVCWIMLHQLMDVLGMCMGNTIDACDCCTTMLVVPKHHIEIYR